MHAEVVGWRQLVIPSPYIIQISSSRSKAVIDRDFAVGYAHSDGVDKCFDVRCHCVSREILGVAHWTDRQEVIVEV